MIPPDTLIVVGMNREAAIFAGKATVAVGTAGLDTRIRGMAAVISFGICGALDPVLQPGDLLIGEAVRLAGETWTCDAAWLRRLAAALPQAKTGIIAGSQAIVGSAQGKAALRRASGAAVVDMESHAAARAAARAGLPIAVLRAVSDGADRALPIAAQAGFRADGQADIGAVIRALARRPWELPALIRTAVDAEAGFQALARAATALMTEPAA